MSDLLLCYWYSNLSKHLLPARLHDAKGSHEEVSFSPVLVDHTHLPIASQQGVDEGRVENTWKSKQAMELLTINESNTGSLWKQSGCGMDYSKSNSGLK